jgi:hypothetical protein
LNVLNYSCPDNTAGAIVPGTHESFSESSLPVADRIVTPIKAAQQIQTTLLFVARWWTATPTQFAESES